METVGIGEIIVMISDIQIKALRSINIDKDDNGMPMDI